MSHIKKFESFSLADPEYKYTVFHGTDSHFDEFIVGDNRHGDLYGKGIYFTDNYKYAKTFGEIVMKCEIVIYNPFDLTKKDMSHFLKIRDYIDDEKELEYFDSGYKSKAYTSILNRLRYKGLFSNKILEELDYDGIIGYSEMGGKEYVVFSPNQVNVIRPSV
jgi:hypothetical protein